MDVPFDGCDVCGDDHATVLCPELGLQNSEYEIVGITRARLTLPHSLQAVDLSTGDVTVYTTEAFGKRSQFGPYEAKKTTHEFNDDGLFVLKIMTKDGTNVSLDTTEESECNWMCLVQAATSAEEQNLIAYQLGTSIFYSATKDLSPGTELKVWYAPQYARRLGKSIEPDGYSKVMLGMKVVYPSVEELAESQTIKNIVEEGTSTLDCVTGEIITENNQTTDSEVGQEPNNVQYELEELENQNVPLTNFQCKRCGEGFMTEIELGKHIRDHIYPPGSGRKGRLPKANKSNKITSKKSQDVKEEPENTEKDEDFTPKPYQIIKQESKDSLALRVLPRRSLKGKRTTGFLVDDEFLLTKNKIKTEPEEIKEEIKEEIHVIIEKTAAPSPNTKRKRGRPKASDQMRREDDGKRRKIFESSKLCNDETLTEDSENINTSEINFISKDLINNKTDEEVSNSMTKLAETAEREISNMAEKSHTIVCNNNENRNAADIPNVELIENSDQNSTSSTIIKHASTVDENQYPTLVSDGNEIVLMELDGNNVDNSIDTVHEEIKTFNDCIGATGQPAENVDETNENLQNQTENLSPGNGNDNQDVNKNEDNADESHENEVNSNNKENTPGDIEETEQMEDSDKNSEKKDETKSKRKRKKKLLPIPMEIRETPNGKEYVCIVCNKKFLTERYLRLHAPMHTNEFQCNTCNKTFARKESLQKHECQIVAKIIEETEMVNIDEQTTQEKKIFQCSNCNEKFDFLYHAEEHLKTHRKEFECDHCKEVFTKKIYLNQHICPKAKENLYSCDICAQTFSNEPSLFRHVAMHTDIYKCEACEKCFSRKDSLIRHVTKCCPDKAEKYGVFSCRKCSKTFGTKLGLENHEANCTMHPCNACNQVFDSLENLELHKCKPLPETNESKAKRVKFSCSDCNKSFKNLHYLLQHKVVHCNSHECVTCGKKMKSQEERDDHERFCLALNKIKQDGKISCDLCKEEFYLAKEYKEHYQLHTHMYHCEKCDKRFVKVGSLHTHQCITDTIKCHLCDRQCKTIKVYHTHMISHSDVVTHCTKCDKYFEVEVIDSHECEKANSQDGESSVKYVCHFCGKSFVSSSNLNKHMKVHGEKLIACPMCPKKFHFPEYLKVHIAGVHEKKTPYQCSECGKILTSKPGLISHMKLFHSKDKEEYPCPECGKCFSQKGNMKTHMFSHAKERTFVCPFCPKAFKYPDQLNRHKLMHTLDNLFQCEICEKKFVKDHELKKHIRANHSNKMYVCEFCGSRCGHRHTLQRHYRRKHPVSAHLVEDPQYMDSLYQEVDIDSMVMEKRDIVVMEHTAQVQQPNGITVTVPIEEMVSHSAAEALSSLSAAGKAQAVISNEVAQLIGQDGTIVQIPGQENMFTVPAKHGGGTDDQQTVVILQIINPQDQQIEVQELETQVIDTAEIETISQDVPDFQYTENILSTS